MTDRLTDLDEDGILTADGSVSPQEDFHRSGEKNNELLH